MNLEKADTLKEEANELFKSNIKKFMSIIMQ